MQPVHLPRLKAPRSHGDLLAYPPLDAVGDLLRANRTIAGSLLGRPLAHLRDRARRETLKATHAYLAAAGEPVPDFPSSTWLVAGHQPELFHPGVWIKNFILQALAREHQATPLNIVVDNDVAKSPVLRVPDGTRVVSVPFDQTGGENPFEERRVLDASIFNSLPERVHALTRQWPFRPWVGEVWKQMQAAAADTPLLGERIVRGRRALERTMGLQPFEVPLSALCQTEAFAWFACALLADLPRFVNDYNSAVHDYRARHDLKSKNHPVPDLARSGATFETPFWIWQPGAARRQRLFAVADAKGLQLFAGTKHAAHLPGDAHAWAASWPTLERQGIKIRTRALTTTLFSRLLLGDLFLHGIGGGKYDEVTDDLMVRFLGLRPPGYLVATATLLLPFPRDADVHDRWLRLKRQERDLWHNPQRHLDPVADATPGLLRKQHALNLPVQTHEQRVVRFRALLQATADLRPFIADRLETLKAQWHALEADVRRDEIAAARDYSFCLYPERMLREYLPDLSKWRNV